jgi:hypothetical protein
MVAPILQPTIRTRTIEQKRAEVHQGLLQSPDDERLRRMLLYLCPAQQIQLGARSGVFVSYSRNDELFAIDLARDLREGGVDVWMDMMDVSYNEDGDWGTEVTQALNRCGLMLMIISRQALQSPDLKRERETFVNAGKIILPIVYDRDEFDLRAYLPPIDCRRSYTTGLQTLLRVCAPKKG